MKHINLTNWHGSITDWTKLNYIYGGLDDTYAVKGNLRIDKDNYNYVEYRESNNLITTLNSSTGTSHTFVDGVLTSSGIDGRSFTDYGKSDFKLYLSAGTYQIRLFNRNITSTQYDNVAVIKETNSILTSNSQVYTNESGNLQFTITDAGNYGFMLKFVGDIKPILVKGTTAPSIYEPYFEGKKYVITETLGIVDLGTLNWEDNIAHYGFKTTSALSPNAFVDNDTKLFNGVVIPKKYTIVNPDSATLYAEDNWIAIGQYNQIIYCKDTTYASAVEFKAGMSGVMLIYQLKDPIIEVVE